MKQFIVMFAILPMLLIFVLQIGNGQANMTKNAAIERIVITAEEQAKKDGIFTTGNKARLTEDLANTLNLQEDEIIFDADGAVKYRAQTYSKAKLIHYTLELPYKGIMAAPAFFGLRDKDNMVMLHMERYVASEKLSP